MAAKAQSQTHSPHGSKRRRARERRAVSGEAKLGVSQIDGSVRIITGQLFDLSESGCGVDADVPLPISARITVASRLLSKEDRLTQKIGQVVYCLNRDGRSYQIGVVFEQPRREKKGAASGQLDEQFSDCYETLQVSPNADSETIQRVYRVLAQRYHPDNAESGNEDAFRQLLSAYRILNDPEKRAAYDANYKAQRSIRWKIFTQPSEGLGVQQEKRTRAGILSALYTMRRTQLEKPGMLLRELENLLGCPREHLEFSMWYLRGKGLLESTDGGRYTITPAGVDATEESEENIIRPPLRLIEDGKAS